MKKLFFLLVAFMSWMSVLASDVELTQLSELTSQYFIMAYNDNGTYRSPYWTRGNNQNVMSPGESSIICHGKDYYYLLKAQVVTYKGEKVYRIRIFNELHSAFPNGIGGAAYLNSAGWCFFAGESEASGKSHVYGQDDDGLGVWRITYVAGKGFQFQCVGNEKYISYTMSNSSSADKYYWQCFAEGSLYNPLEALKESAPYAAHTDMRKMLLQLVNDQTNITADDAERIALRQALATAKQAVDDATTEDEILQAVVALRIAGCAFLNTVTLADGYQVNATPLLINASFPCNSGEGWEGTEPGFQTHGNAEFYSKNYNVYQTIPDLPQGRYMLRVQGYQRSEDGNTKAMTSYLNGALTQSEGYFYANEQQMPLSLICRDAQTIDALGGTKYTIGGTNYWLPNSMSEAAKFFNNGKYWNTMIVNHMTRGDLTIGLRCSVGSWGTWTCFDNFELYYQGNSGEVSDVTYLITNPSFETGTTDGWTVGKLSQGGDVGVKKNEGVYETKGTDGDYLFNTWSLSDNYTYGTPDQFVEQTLYNMKPGEYRLRALSSSNTYQSIKEAVELYGNDYAISFVPPSKSEFRETYEVTIYLMPSDTKLTIGMRSGGWFRADHFRLYYFGQTEEYEMERRTATIKRYEQIASQAIDRSAYDAVLNEVRTALMVPEITDDEIVQQNDRLYEALMQLVKTGTTATGQFDLTILLPRKGVQRARNISATTTLGQTMPQMPAGHYTFRANALFRSAVIGEALESYEGGTEDRPAIIYLDNVQAQVMNLFDDPRHATTKSSDIFATIDGRAAPMTESAAFSAFAQGDYATVVETDLAADGPLTLGFRIKKPKKTDNAFLATNMKLLYGATPTVSIDKTVPAEKLTPLCVPFDLESTATRQLYYVGSVLDGQATLFPVSAIRAGEPCVVYSTEEITGFTIPATQMKNKQADITPLPWDGGTMNSDLTHFTWTATSVDGKTVTKAEQLEYTIADPMNMDFSVNLENLQARRFLEQEDYNATTSSHITNYNVAPPARRDYPNSVGVPVAGPCDTKYKLRYATNDNMAGAKSLTGYVTNGKLFYVPNLVPQRTYYYEVLSGNDVVGKGKFHTEGHLRMIYAPSIDNIRDLGGWKTADGRYIRYERIYRGGELNGSHTATAAAVRRLRNLGVTAEIDLRIDYEESAGTSAFGFTTAAGTFYYANAMDCEPENMTDQECYKRWKAEFDLIMKNLRKGGNIFFHCRIGADRTGLLSLMLEGLLGLPKDLCNKNYELTTLSPSGVRTRDTQNKFMDYFEKLSGSTLQQKFNTFFRQKLGVSQANIDEFRSIMLTDDLINSIEDTQVIEVKSPVSNTYYDLSGRAVTPDRLAKGIYIRGGKKIVVSKH